MNLWEESNGIKLHNYYFQNILTQENYMDWKCSIKQMFDEYA